MHLRNACASCAVCALIIIGIHSVNVQHHDIVCVWNNACVLRICSVYDSVMRLLYVRCVGCVNQCVLVVLLRARAWLWWYALTSLSRATCIVKMGLCVLSGLRVLRVCVFCFCVSCVVVWWWYMNDEGYALNTSPSKPSPTFSCNTYFSISQDFRRVMLTPNLYYFPIIDCM